MLRVTSKGFEFKEKYLLSKTYAETEDDENEDGNQKEEVKQQPSTILDFTSQALIREGILEDMETVLVLPNKEINI